jgi:hypothetical protein
MIVTSISTDIDRYYNLDKRTVVKNILDPLTQKISVEYVQYFYTKTGEVQPTKSVGLNIDKYA